MLRLSSSLERIVRNKNIYRIDNSKLNEFKGATGLVHFESSKPDLSGNILIDRTLIYPIQVCHALYVIV